MRLHRFYVSQPLGEEVVTDDVSLVSQWSKVFRYEKGDFVILFNGDGKDVTYEIISIERKKVTLHKKNEVLSIQPSRSITLYLSLIKKDNFELVVQKGTELGITRFVPIISERSEKKNLSFERLNKIAIEAAEQCGRGDIPLISPIVTLEIALNELDPTFTPIIFAMDGKPLPKIEGGIALFIGPEGGWGEHDMKVFEAKNIGIYALTKTTLRAETAAIAACTLLSI